MKDSDRDERSRGIEIHITDYFVIIKPTEPFKLVKLEARRKRNWSDSSGNSFVKTDASRWACRNKNRINEDSNLFCLFIKNRQNESYREDL
jgi:hypothetical protein